MKGLLFAALMMVCSVSWAEWKYTESTDTYILFHDKSTKRRNGAIVKMWALKDYFEVQTDVGEPFKSEKSLWKHNCKDETSALVSASHYSESSGRGRVTWNHTLSEHEIIWQPVAPDSVGETEWKIACSNK